MSRWLPELIRAEPAAELDALYRVVGASPSGWSRAQLMEALLAAHVSVGEELPGGLRLDLPFRTLVYGLIRRDLEEAVVLSIRPTGDGIELHLSCHPAATHSAHAAGMAGVVALAAAVWLTGGWLRGAPAGLTTLVAGFLWTATAREMALQTLHSRLRRLAGDIGAALWPGLPATLLPPPPRLVPG